MPATSARVAPAHVRTAGRRGPDRPTEDRIFRAGNAIILLDGASQPDSGDRDGGWYAETLGKAIHQRLSAQPLGDLAAVLADAIGATAETHGLEPGQSPSATVSIVRWGDHHVDVLVLGDSPVVVLTPDGTVRQIRDDRLKDVGQPLRRQLAAAGGLGLSDHNRWRELIQAERAARNRTGGYWIAEALPAAATHARRRQWDRADVATVLVMSDGVSAGVDRYATPPDWPTAFAIARKSPEDLVELVHTAEASDPDGRRWPRSKRHDDKAVALLELGADRRRQDSKTYSSS